MNAVFSPVPPAQEESARSATLSRLLAPHALIAGEGGRTLASWRQAQLASHFQSVFAADRSRILGAQGLVRLHGAGPQLSPWQLFSRAADGSDLVALDRLCRALHVANFGAGFARGEVLFLNVHPALPEVVKSEFGLSFTRILALLGVPPGRCVLELRLDPTARPGLMRDALRGWRARGFGVAVDLGLGPNRVTLESLEALGVVPDAIKFTPTSELDVSRAALAPWAAAGVKLIGTRLGDAGSVALALAAGAQWLQGRAIDAKA